MSFSEWLDGILATLEVDAAAFNFNIYENREAFSIELIATESFDEYDADWGCDEIYASRNDNNEFYFREKDWQSALAFAKDSISAYLENGRYASKLKSTQAVGCGFVDGDLYILYQK